MHVRKFCVVVPCYNFVMQQCLIVITKLGSSACGARAYWVKRLTMGRSGSMVWALVRE